MIFSQRTLLFIRHQQVGIHKMIRDCSIEYSCIGGNIHLGADTIALLVTVSTGAIERFSNNAFIILPGEKSYTPNCLLI